MLAPDVDTHSDNAKRDDAGDGDDDADDDNEVTAISRLGPPLRKIRSVCCATSNP